MSRTILVIDDERPILDLAEKMLALSGFTVGIAQNPEDGIARLAREKFDLVLTDIDMPQMDGLALVLRVRTLYPNIPIIAMSGSALRGGGVGFATEIGANAAISKPFKRAELIDLIQRLIPGPPPNTPSGG